MNFESCSNVLQTILGSDSESTDWMENFGGVNEVSLAYADQYIYEDTFHLPEDRLSTPSLGDIMESTLMGSNYFQDLSSFEDGSLSQPTEDMQLESDLLNVESKENTKVTSDVNFISSRAAANDVAWKSVLRRFRDWVGLLFKPYKKGFNYWYGQKYYDNVLNFLSDAPEIRKMESFQDFQPTNKDIMSFILIINSTAAKVPTKEKKRLPRCAYKFVSELELPLCQVFRTPKIALIEQFFQNNLVQLLWKQYMEEGHVHNEKQLNLMTETKKAEFLKTLYSYVK